MYWKRETFPCTGKQQLWTYCRVFSQKLRGVQRIRLFRCSDVAVTVYTACRGEDQQFRCDSTSLCVPTRYVCDGENHCGDWSDELNCSQSNAIVLSTSMVELMPLHPKPHRFLPCLNPDWFYLPVGTGLPRLSWKKGC